MSDVDNVCEPCRDGDHHECVMYQNHEWMCDCIDMEHDVDD